MRYPQLQVYPTFRSVGYSSAGWVPTDARESPDAKATLAFLSLISSGDRVLKFAEPANQVLIDSSLSRGCVANGGAGEVDASACTVGFGFGMGMKGNFHGGDLKNAKDLFRECVTQEIFGLHERKPEAAEEFWESAPRDAAMAAGGALGEWKRREAAARSIAEREADVALVQVRCDFAYVCAHT